MQAKLDPNLHNQKFYFERQPQVDIPSYNK